MGNRRGRWSWSRAPRELEAATEAATESATESATGSEVRRRTLLVGAAATAGAVAVGTSPAVASPAVGSTPLVSGASALGAAGSGSVAASDVSVVPVGEITDTDVQSALASLDGRLGKVHLIDDLQVAMTLVDDFMGTTTTSGTIGAIGWASLTGATGTITIPSVAGGPGIVQASTGTTSTGFQGINLGASLKGAPVLMCEWRVRLTNTNVAGDAASCWFGLHNDSHGAEPTTGLYFRYTAADGPNWRAVCNNGGASTNVNTPVAADVAFHRFRITSDGAGVVRFYIDDVLVATITSNIPSTSNRHGPALSVRKTTGTTSFGALIDYFAMRYEFNR